MLGVLGPKAAAVWPASAQGSDTILGNKQILELVWFYLLVIVTIANTDLVFSMYQALF